MARENTDGILVLGGVKLLEYSTDGEERTGGVKYLGIRQKDGVYDIDINHSTESEYLVFRIDAIKSDEYIHTGTLSNISFEDLTGMASYDDEATGTIEIDERSKTVKLEVEMVIHHRKQKVILRWENRAME